MHERLRYSSIYSRLLSERYIFSNSFRISAIRLHLSIVSFEFAPIDVAVSEISGGNASFVTFMPIPTTINSTPPLSKLLDASVSMPHIFFLYKEDCRR